jgi:signal transduction histidine kinase
MAPNVASRSHVCLICVKKGLQPVSIGARLCYTIPIVTTLHSGLNMDSRLRMLRVVRWVLPLSLAAIAVLFELNEHMAEGSSEIEAWFIVEIVLFAVIGPVAVAITLGWVERLVSAYQEASAQLAASNRDLEERIAVRTAHLAKASEQLRAANADLARANDDLRQLDRLKSEFVSLVSHQLRAPLTNINGALEIVAQEAESLPESTNRTLRILLHEGQRLSWLIQTILDVSRIEAGRLQPRLGPVAIGPLLGDACAATLSVDSVRPHRLLVAERLPPAWADETLLGEVVRNLIENAMRYSPPESVIEVSADVVGSEIEVSVADHGAGIPVEEQERIFQSFHRASDDEASIKGSGLGLYFADRLIHAQGGSIRVESPVWPDASAPGSRFSFRIPLAEDIPADDGFDDGAVGDG